MAKILVVDDEMGIRELLSEILDDEGHDVQLAENASAARAQYQATDFSLVLLDIWMPDLDGMSLLREWSNAATLKCPVVMMSGHASIDAALEAQSLGAVGFLEKPITLHKLLSEVHKALSRSKPAQIDSAAIEPTTPAVIDVNATLTNTIHHDVSEVSFDSLAAFANMSAHTHTHAGTSLVAPQSVWQIALSTLPLDVGLREFREQAERVYFTHMLEQENWGMTRVAERAGLERTHLYRKLKQLNIEFSRKSKQ